MKINNFLHFWNSGLNAVKRNDDFTIVDDYYKENEDFNYGESGIYTEEDLMVMDFANLIPDIYFEGTFNHLFDEVFPEQYKLSEAQIADIKDTVQTKGFEFIADKLKEFNCQEDYHALQEICDVLKGTECLDFSDVKAEEKEETSLEEDVER